MAMMRLHRTILVKSRVKRQVELGKVIARFNRVRKPALPGHMGVSRKRRAVRVFPLPKSFLLPVIRVPGRW